MLETRLTQRFDLQYPILSAPMARHSGGKLAAAVSKAGGMGTFGVSMSAPGWVRDQINMVREVTDKPFAVGFLTHMIEQDKELFELALEERVPAMTFSFADPAPWLQRAKDAGIATICQVQSVEGARQAVDAGTDVLVVQGTEAGGHTAEAHLLPTLEAVIEKYPDTIVMAAGGIASGRALAAVLGAGADGAWMGTRFLATPEAVEISDAHKQMILNAASSDTLFTYVYDMIAGRPWPAGVGARALRNAVIDRWHGHEDELKTNIDQVRAEVNAAVEKQGPPGRGVLMGTGVDSIRSIEPAAEIMASICDEAERLLRRF